MLVMQQYVQRYIGTEQALAAALGSAMSGQPDLPQVRPGPADLPVPQRARSSRRSCREQTAAAGVTLVDGRRVRVPGSTEQVLHPEKYLVGVERPLPVRLGRPARAPAGGA